MAYSKSGISQYYSLELSSKISSASPHKLISMLFEGLLLQLRRARESALQNQYKAMNQGLEKATKIIAGLHDSLSTRDVESDLPYDLARLYDYMQALLLKTRVDNDIAHIDEVISLVEVLSSGWVNISDKTSP